MSVSGMSVLRVGVCICECLHVQMCVCGCTPEWGAGMPLCTHPAGSGTWGGRGESWLCPPAPAMPDLPGILPQVTLRGPALRRGWQQGQDPPGLQVQEAPVGRSSPSPPSLPGTAMLPALLEEHSLGRQALPEHWTPTGLSCAPQGHGAAGSVPAGGQGATAGQPPRPSPPHQPDAGQCREEIQALSGGWLQPLPQPAASGPKFPGVATTTVLPWALPSPPRRGAEPAGDTASP